jgi:predicted nucleotidyltransferase
LTTAALERQPSTIQNDPILRATLRDFQCGLHQIYGPNPPRIILYGSYARGEAHEDSDIDLVLLFRHQIAPPEEIDRISYLLADLNLEYQMLVSIVPTTEERYKTASDPFWRNVRREGIEIE